MSPNEELKTRWYFLHKTLNKATFNTRNMQVTFFKSNIKISNTYVSNVAMSFWWLCLSPNKQIVTTAEWFILAKNGHFVHLILLCKFCTNFDGKKLCDISHTSCGLFITRDSKWMCNGKTNVPTSVLIMLVEDNSMRLVILFKKGYCSIVFGRKNVPRPPSSSFRVTQSLSQKNFNGNFFSSSTKAILF